MRGSRLRSRACPSRMTSKSTWSSVWRLSTRTGRFEVKNPSNPSDKAHCAKVARAAMAVGNLRGGGLACIGVARIRKTPSPNRPRMRELPDSCTVQAFKVHTSGPTRKTPCR